MTDTHTAPQRQHHNPILAVGSPDPVLAKG